MNKNQNAGHEAGEPPFACGEVALLRAPLLPFARPGAPKRAGHTGSADAAENQAWTAYIANLAAEPLLAEAVELSSPSLGGLVRRLQTGEPLPKLKVQRSAAFSLTRYQLRMMDRATPFGLLAGVASARFEDATQGRLSGQHQRFSRPDMAWLMRLVRDLECRPQVLPTLRVVANHAVTVRGGRVVLAYASNTELGEGPTAAARKQQVSVRWTAAVAEALSASQAAISVPVLEEKLSGLFPESPPATTRRLLETLINHEFLLTSLRPPLHRADPLGHVLEQLDGLDGVPEADMLRELRHEMAAYDCLPVGKGRDALLALQSRMRSVCDAEKPLQVDLALDADIRLPREVAREAERAAAVLWRIGPRQPGHPALRSYHREFLERYGIGRAVPLLELLDPDIGLDAPAGYLSPPSRARSQVPVASAGDDPREQVLAELFVAALAEGRREVILDEETVSRMCGHGDEPHLVPPSCELLAQVVSPSARALDEGDFRLIVTGVSPVAGAAFGRFAHMLRDRDGVVATVRGTGTFAAGAVRANVVFQPRMPRPANIALAPAWLGLRIAIGAGPDDSERKDLHLADLAVAATLDRLYLVSRTLGREVVPAAVSLINAYGLAPNVARFLQEIGMEGPRRCVPWSWGTFEQAPFLPRVRYGRAILWPATWRPSPRLRAGEFGPDWAEEFREWRRQQRLPSQVGMGAGESQIHLDLNNPMHLWLLHAELARRPGLWLQEPPGGEEIADGWLHGPGGPHRCEMVFPMLRRRTPVPQPVAPAVAPARSVPALAQPGSDWLYAQLYVSAANQSDILRGLHRGPLSRFLAISRDDRWFYLRYNQPEPHLRLRFHGRPETLWASLLPAMCEWTDDLHRSGTIGRLSLDTYDPELERYGGPQLIADAERVFAADSKASLTMLGILGSPEAGTDPLLIMAAGLVDLLVTFVAGLEPDAARRPRRHAELLALTGGRDEQREAFSSRRRAALELIDPGQGWTALAREPFGAALAEAFAERRPAVLSYARRVRTMTAGGHCWTPQERIAISLLHMHCNRVLGTNREAEAQTMAIARGVIRAHQVREQARSVS